MLQSKEWCPEKQFVTYLNYVLQMSCIMLQHPSCKYVINDQYLLEREYILPVLKKMDVYLIVEDFHDTYEYTNLIDDGIELIINGRSMKGKDVIDVEKYLSELYGETIYLNKETDAKYFPDNYEDRISFTPYETNLKDYLLAGETNDRRINDIFDFDSEYGLSEVKVLVNGKIQFDEMYRKYPIHYIYESEEGLKFIRALSWKYSTLAEMFVQILFPADRFGWCGKEKADKYKLKNAFILVLDCDEICDIRTYWDGESD